MHCLASSVSEPRGVLQVSFLDVLSFVVCICIIPHKQMISNHFLTCLSSSRLCWSQGQLNFEQVVSLYIFYYTPKSFQQHSPSTFTTIAVERKTYLCILFLNRRSFVAKRSARKEEEMNCGYYLVHVAKCIGLWSRA